MFYNARWYDPYITHFTQADTIIPGGVQGLDRYAAMNNNPVKYSDPSGHMADQGDAGGCSIQHPETHQCPTTNPTTVIVPVKDTATIVDEIHDKIDDLEERDSAIAAGAGFVVGILLAGVSCPTTAFVGCAAALSVGSGVAGWVAGELITQNPDIDILNKVSDAFAVASGDSTTDSLTIEISFHPETGSQVAWNEQEQYLEMNSDYHPDQYVLRIGGKTIVLTPEQAIMVNKIIGGLLP
jgi:hypothetical protein